MDHSRIAQILCVISIGCALSSILISVFKEDPQQCYEEVYKGEVECIDTPDGKVYCYKVGKEKSK